MTFRSALIACIYAASFWIVTPGHGADEIAAAPESVGGVPESVGGAPESMGEDRALPSHLELDFEAYFGGLHVASARTLIQVREAAYSVDGWVRARGLLDLATAWKGYAFSEGVLDPVNGVVPKEHRNEGYVRGESRSLVLTFNPDGSVAVERSDRDEEDEPKTPVPPESLPGSVDPFSALVSLAALLNDGGSCDGSIPVFDGRRRYDINLTSGGTKAFEASRYSIFSGVAEACLVELDRIGGFRIERSKYYETARNQSVWVAAPLQGIAPIPVRLEIETDYGKLLVHLTAARFAEQEIALTPGEDNLAD